MQEHDDGDERRRRRARTCILSSSTRRVHTHTHTYAPSLFFSLVTTSRELPSSHRTTGAVPLSLLSRICFSDGANFRRYGSIGEARSRRGLGRSFGISCRPYGFCLVNERRRNVGEAVAHRSNIYAIEYIAHTHTSLGSAKLSPHRVSIAAMIADR